MIGGIVMRAARERRRVVRRRADGGRVQGDGDGGDRPGQRREGIAEHELVSDCIIRLICGLTVHRGSGAVRERIPILRLEIDGDPVLVAGLENAACRIQKGARGHIIPEDVIAGVFIIMIGGIVMRTAGEHRRVVRRRADGGRVQRDGNGGDRPRQRREGICDPELGGGHPYPCGLSVHRGSGAVRERIPILRRQIDGDLVQVAGLEYAAFRIHVGVRGQIPPPDVIAEHVVAVWIGIIVRAGGEHRRVVRRRADGGRVQRDGDGGDTGCRLRRRGQQGQQHGESQQQRQGFFSRSFHQKHLPFTR